MAKASVAAIILSGGKSERFGSNKGLYSYQGKPLMIRAIDIVDPISDRIIISIAPGQRKYYEPLVGKEYSIIEDEDAFEGPLSGLKTVLSVIDENITLLIPCDMPFLKTEFFTFLIERLEGHDACIPLINGYLEPIFSVYRTEPLHKAVSYEIGNGGRKLSGILRHLKVKSIDIREFESAGIDSSNFVNLNAPL
ncbi:MAG: molybdenum cofactor guanylyltransferase [Thermoplasmata archaeon]|nr:molybdenum cofactor guanylyltransferase [Thermoplasmata archaeon]